MRVKRSRRVPVSPEGARSSTASKAIGLGVAALAVVPAANAASFNVTNLNDSGAGSLRQAIADANGAAGADVVTFQAALTGTITLTTGQLYITDSLDIQGPGAAALTVSGNNASRVFYLYSNSQELDVRIAGLTITGGNETIGAGIVNFDEDLTLENVIITGNAASGDGGGLWADGFNMNLTIRNTTISGNTAGSDGGGIYVEDTGGPLLIENSVISGNEATGGGGGIYFYDPDNDVTIRNTTISGNTAYIGGGTYLYSHDSGVHTIEGSTISGNQAQAGGGLALYSPDHGLAITNTTISGNQALAGPGGGIYLYNLYNGSLNFVTIANNSAGDEGGGVFVTSSSLPVTNSIIADNTAQTNNDLGNGIAGGFDLAYSLVETPGTASITDNGGNLLSTDPQLGALANNGGPTETQRPGLTSPVINAADPAFVPPPADDQRGEDRVVAGRADMGALEINGGTIQFNPQAYAVAETGGSVNLTVVRDVGPDPASISYTTVAGTATPGAGNDYTTTAGTLTFVAGDLSETINVPILNDNVAEPAEAFTATLSSPSAGATLGAATPATVTINDDPAGTAQLTVTTINTTEDAVTVDLTVTRTGGTEGPLTVNFATADGTATAPSDYGAAAGVVTFPAGDATPQTITLTIANDPTEEPDETFTVALSGPAAGTPNSATITIAANDVRAVPVPALSLFGKLLLGALSTAAGLWAIMRSRLSIMLLGILFLGAIAAPPLSAADRVAGNAQKKHDEQKAAESKEGKTRGTLQSVANNDNGQITLTFTNGTSLSLRTDRANITDLRGATPKPGAFSDVTAGRTVVVKVRKDGKVKIKIVS